MKASYPTYDAAKADLLGQGFTRCIEPTQGAELFSKPDKVDDWYGGYASPCIVRIRRNAVAARWGDPRNYYTIDFL